MALWAAAAVTAGIAEALANCEEGEELRAHDGRQAGQPCGVAHQRVEQSEGSVETRSSPGKAPCAGASPVGLGATSHRTPQSAPSSSAHVHAPATPRGRFPRPREARKLLDAALANLRVAETCGSRRASAAAPSQAALPCAAEDAQRELAEDKRYGIYDFRRYGLSGSKRASPARPTAGNVKRQHAGGRDAGAGSHPPLPWGASLDGVDLLSSPGDGCGSRRLPGHCESGAALHGGGMHPRLASAAAGVKAERLDCLLPSRRALPFARLTEANMAELEDALAPDGYSYALARPTGALLEDSLLHPALVSNLTHSVQLQNILIREESRRALYAGGEQAGLGRDSARGSPEPRPSTRAHLLQPHGRPTPSESPPVPWLRAGRSSLSPPKLRLDASPPAPRTYVSSQAAGKPLAGLHWGDRGRRRARGPAAAETAWRRPRPEAVSREELGGAQAMAPSRAAAVVQEALCQLRTPEEAAPPRPSGAWDSPLPAQPLWGEGEAQVRAPRCITPSSTLLRPTPVGGAVRGNNWRACALFLNALTQHASADAAHRDGGAASRGLVSSAAVSRSHTPLVPLAGYDVGADSQQLVSTLASTLSAQPHLLEELVRAAEQIERAGGEARSAGKPLGAGPWLAQAAEVFVSAHDKRMPT